MKVKWQIQIWRKEQPVDTLIYYLEVPEDDLAVRETEMEKNAVIDFYIKKEFERNVTFFRVRE